MQIGLESHICISFKALAKHLKGLVFFKPTISIS